MPPKKNNKSKKKAAKNTNEPKTPAPLGPQPQEPQPPEQKVPVEPASPVDDSRTPAPPITVESLNEDRSPPQNPSKLDSPQQPFVESEAKNTEDAPPATYLPREETPPEPPNEASLEPRAGSPSEPQEATPTESQETVPAEAQEAAPPEVKESAPPESEEVAQHESQETVAPESQERTVEETPEPQGEALQQNAEASQELPAEAVSKPQGVPQETPEPVPTEPQEQAPQETAELAQEHRPTEAPQETAQPTPEVPKEEPPQGISEPAPEQPQAEVPQETAKPAPAEPQEGAPQEITRQAPEEPKEDASQKISESASVESQKEAPQETFEPAAAEPEEEAPKKTPEQTLQEPQEQKTEEAPQKISEPAPAEPQGEVPQETPKPVPTKTQEEAPAEPREVHHEISEETSPAPPVQAPRKAPEELLSELQKEASPAPRVTNGTSVGNRSNGVYSNGLHKNINVEDTNRVSTTAAPNPWRSAYPTHSAYIPLTSPPLVEPPMATSPALQPRPSYPSSPTCAAYSQHQGKVSSPFVHTYMPGFGSVTAPDVTIATPASVDPLTLPSFATALRSPAMSASTHYRPYHQRVGSTASSGRSFGSSYFGSPYQPVREPSLKSSGGLFDQNGALNLGHDEHEPLQLLTRISNVIPDLNRLLHAHRETRDKLSVREAEIKQMESEHEQALMHKDFYIEALQAQIRKVANENAEECSRWKKNVNELKSEIKNLQGKNRDLDNTLAASQKTNSELSQSRTQLEEEIDKLHSSIQDAKIAHEKELEKKECEKAALAAQERELTELFERVRSEDERAAAETLEARERELLDDFEQQKRTLRAENENALNEKQSELDSKAKDLEATQKELHDTNVRLDTTTADLDSKKAGLASIQTELVSTKADLDSTKTDLDSTKADLDSTKADLNSTKSDLDSTRAQLNSTKADLDSTKTELSSTKTELDTTKADLELTQNALENKEKELEEARQMHAEELDSLRNAHKEELAAKQKESDEKIAALEADCSEKERNWADNRANLENQLLLKTEGLTNFEKEKEAQGKRIQGVFDEMRSTMESMDKDRERLKKTLHSLGEVTDLKNTKGDTFFLDCFAQLSRLIVDLSKEYFAYLPIDPPKDVLAKIPAEIPPFLDNTPASHELRSAYVQHVVSKTLTYRVFQPFIFTLGKRYDKADTFFQMLSLDIRRKSIRREAIWRQLTLKAAYTTSDARQSINVVAAVVVDEIIEQIRHFADPKQLDALLTGVRKIVKLAAETWRHARVERELILAMLPAPAAEDVSNKEWEEYPSEREPSPSRRGDHGRHVILRIFPRIFREAAHEDFVDDKDKRNPCVYSPGTVLYSDSPVILARVDEIAGKGSDSPVVGSRASSRGSIYSNGVPSPRKCKDTQPQAGPDWKDIRTQETEESAIIV
ncbi:hypothetical protein VTN00DRAFT_2818 [Thermoascus crustaceus]|uniref:uncharacterized protein n=1 Tax=Thermoascus crustaceus TaxID=5088 RepID=UPI003742D709